MTAQWGHSGFEPGVELARPETLAGHSEQNGLLDDMLRELMMGSSFHVYGERRSGKTSVLRCLQTRLEERARDRVGLYLNFRLNSSVQGAGDAHRFVIAHLQSAAVKRGLAAQVPLQALPNDDRWEKSYALLMSTPDFEIPRILGQYVDMFGRVGIGVILLIDEYEHLMLKTYKGEAGAFFAIRDLSTREAISGVKPLCFVIAGSEPWQEICEICGSPELNTATTGFVIGAIKSDAFKSMWDACLAGSSEDVQANVNRFGHDGHSVFELAGGWPFYGKVIGHSLGAAKGVELAEASLLPHFEIVWRRLSTDERTALFRAETGELHEREGLGDLILRGLLARDGDGGLVPNGTFWSRFVRSKASEEQQATIEEKRKLVFQGLDDIQQSVFSDDILRVALAALLTTVRNWARTCRREADLKVALGLLQQSAGREHQVLKEIVVSMKLGTNLRQERTQ